MSMHSGAAQSLRVRHPTRWRISSVTISAYRVQGLGRAYGCATSVLIRLAALGVPSPVAMS